MEQSFNSQSAVKIFFHGSLRPHQPDDVVEVQASNAYEAVRAMIHKYPEMRNVPHAQRPVVQVVGVKSKRDLYSPLTSNEVHLVPAMLGSGGNFGRGLVTVVIAAAVVIAAPHLGLGLAATTAISSAGIALGVGGVISMLTPSPRRDSGTESIADPEASRYLGATGNTTKIGTPIPIAYGINRIYGHYISFDVRALDMAISDNIT